MKAMIFAAGLGTRLGELTAHTPKALVPVLRRPLLEWTILRLYHAGATDIVVNVHHFSEQVIRFLRTFPSLPGLSLRVSDETDCLLDTGGGLKKALPLFSQYGSDEPILIHNVDIFSNVDLTDFYRHAGNHDALLLVNRRTTTGRYLLLNEEDRLVGWTNIKTGEVRTPYQQLDLSRCRQLAFDGIHVVSPRLSVAMQTWPECFGIMDFYIRECHRLDIRGYELHDLQLLDVGKPETISQAANFIQNYSSELLG